MFLSYAFLQYSDKVYVPYKKNTEQVFISNLCKKAAKQYGEKLHVNHWSRFTSKTHIGDNCHFNGIKVTGNGNVTIGNNFHSGRGILILTSN